MDPPLTVKATVVLVLGLESARGPAPANRKQILEIDSLILIFCNSRDVFNHYSYAQFGAVLINFFNSVNVITWS